MRQLKARGTRPLLVNIVTIFSFKEITTPRSVFRKEHTWRTINRPTSTSCLCGSPEKGFLGIFLVSFLPRPRRNSSRLFKIREPIWVISFVHHKTRSSGLSLGTCIQRRCYDSEVCETRRDFGMRVGRVARLRRSTSTWSWIRCRVRTSHGDIAIRWWINPHEKRDRMRIDATHTYTHACTHKIVSSWVLRDETNAMHRYTMPVLFVIAHGGRQMRLPRTAPIF